MESRDATFFENEFPMKNTPSASSHDSISFDDIHEPINNADFETHVETPEEDNNTVARKSKRRRVVNLLVKTLLYTLWKTLPQPLLRHIHLLMLTYGRRQCKMRWISLCLMGLEK